MNYNENYCRHEIGFDEPDFVCCPWCFAVIDDNMPGSETARELIRAEIGREREKFKKLFELYCVAWMIMLVIFVFVDAIFISKLSFIRVYICTYYLFALIGASAVFIGKKFKTAILKRIYYSQYAHIITFAIWLGSVAAILVYRKYIVIKFLLRPFESIGEYPGGLEQLQRTGNYSYVSCAAISLILLGYFLLCLYQYRTAAELTEKAEGLDAMCYAQDMEKMEQMYQMYYNNGYYYRNGGYM